MINGVELTIQQVQQVRELQSIDRNVKLTKQHIKPLEVV